MIGVKILPRKPPSKIQSMANVDKNFGFKRVMIASKNIKEIVIMKKIWLVIESETKRKTDIIIKPTCRSKEKNSFIFKSTPYLEVLKSKYINNYNQNR